MTKGFSVGLWVLGRFCWVLCSFGGVLGRCWFGRRSCVGFVRGFFFGSGLDLGRGFCLGGVGFLIVLLGYGGLGLFGLFVRGRGGVGWGGGFVGLFGPGCGGWLGCGGRVRL